MGQEIVEAYDRALVGVGIVDSKPALFDLLSTHFELRDRAAPRLHSACTGATDAAYRREIALLDTGTARCTKRQRCGGRSGVQERECSSAVDAHVHANRRGAAALI